MAENRSDSPSVVSENVRPSSMSAKPSLFNQTEERKIKLSSLEQVWGKFYEKMAEESKSCLLLRHMSGIIFCNGQIKWLLSNVRS